MPTCNPSCDSFYSNLTKNLAIVAGWMRFVRCFYSVYSVLTFWATL